MSIGLCDIDLIKVFLILRFGLIWFGSSNENRETNQIMQLSKNLNTSKPNAVSIWIDLVYGFSIRLVRF